MLTKFNKYKIRHIIIKQYSNSEDFAGYGIICSLREAYSRIIDLGEDFKEMVIIYSLDDYRYRDTVYIRKKDLDELGKYLMLEELKK